MSTPQATVNAARKDAEEAEKAVNEILSNVSSEQHVRVRVNDLVAYEYVCQKTKTWKWGLGTVAGLPGPRLVQLMLWSNVAEGGLPQSPPTENPISPEERAEAAKELAAIEAQKAEVATQVEQLNKTLSATKLRYTAGKEGYVQDLEEAERTVKEVQREMQSLPESDWREMRSYVQPSAVVQLVLEATMLTLGERTYSWHDIRNVLRSKAFIKDVTEFDPASITPANRQKLQKYVRNPRFSYDDAMNASRALGALQRWVTAQLEAANIKTGLTNFDSQRKKDKADLDKMEKQMTDFQRNLAEFDEKESKLRNKIGDSPVPVQLGKAGPSTTSPTRAAHMPSSADGDSSSPPPPATRNTAPPTTAPETLPGGRKRTQSVFGTNSTWSFTDETIIILKSSILVDYDSPKSTSVTLTPQQVEDLKQALETRAAPEEQEAKAEAQRKDMQDQIDKLLDDLADAQQAIDALKQDNNDKDRDIAAKVRELEALNNPAAHDDEYPDETAATPLGVRQSRDTAVPATAPAASPDAVAAKDAEMAALRDHIAEVEKAAEDAMKAADAAQREADKAKEETDFAQQALNDALEALAQATKDAQDAHDALNKNPPPTASDPTAPVDATDKNSSPGEPAPADGKTAEELQKENDDLKDEIDNLKQQLDDLKKPDEPSSDAARDPAAAPADGKTPEELQKENDDLKDRLQDAEKAIEDAKKALQPPAEEKPKGKGKAKKEPTPTPAQELADLKDRLKDAEKALDDAEKALKDGDSEPARRLDGSRALPTDATQSPDDKDREIDDLKKQIDELKKQLGEPSPADASAASPEERADSGAPASAARDPSGAAPAKPTDGEYPGEDDKTPEELKQEIDDLKDEVEDLKKQLEDAKRPDEPGAARDPSGDAAAPADGKTPEELKQENDDLKDEIDNLKQQLDDVKKPDEPSSDAARDPAAAPADGKTPEELKKENDDLKDRLKDAEKAIEDAKKALQPPAEEKPKGKGKAKGPKAKKDKTPDELKKENDDLKDRLKDAEKALDDAENALKNPDAEGVDKGGREPDTAKRGLEPYFSDPNTPNAPQRARDPNGSSSRALPSGDGKIPVEEGRPDLRDAIDKLEKEIKTLRTESANARDALNDINTTFESNNRLKSFFHDLFKKDKEDAERKKAEKEAAEDSASSAQEL